MLQCYVRDLGQQGHWQSQLCKRTSSEHQAEVTSKMSHLSKEAFWLGDLDLSIPVSPGLYINTRLLLCWLRQGFFPSPGDENHRQR